MNATGAAETFEDFDPESHPVVQFPPPGDGDPAGATAANRPGLDDPVASLREDLRKLAEDVEAIDRRDTAQHGGLRGEIAHLVRRVARLEALPKFRQAR